ncbi:AsmA-like C-terminal region-containing protein [Henriciella sp.]|uniref:YhdP family protein n=1 Tax=Henriciella sp. TaxID=1968823 RepID=UPI00262D9E4F|nr:AsmA-like C-terminal region-containing protein [Henriciella sp.]
MLLLAVAAAAGLAFMLAQGPVELSLFKDDVESALEEARDGRNVDIDALTLRWAPSDRQMIVSASGLTLSDENGNTAAEASEAVITLDAGSLVFGRTEIHSTELRNGWVDVRNVSPTLWTFAGEPLPEFEARELPESVDGWLQLINSAVGDILTGLDASRRESSLEAASFEAMELRFFGPDGDSLGTMTNAAGALISDDDGLRAELAGSGAGLGLPGDIEADLTVPEAFDTLALDARIGAWSVGDLAARLGLSEDRIAGFPADIGLGVAFKAGEGIQQVALSAEAGQGQVSFASTPRDIDRLVFDTVYIPETDTLEINQLDLASESFSGAWSGTLEYPGDGGANNFTLESDNLEFDFRPYFPQAWQIRNVSLSGTVDYAGQDISFADFAFDTGKATLTGEAQLSARDAEHDGSLPFALTVQAEMEGEVTKTDVLRFWPETLGDSAREFAEKRVQAVRATAATVRLDLRSENITGDRLRDDALEVRFFVDEAAVKFMEDLPPVTQGIGTARLTGNGFSVQLDSGEYGGWALNEGSVNIPSFDSKEDRLRVYAKGQGPLVNVMRNIVRTDALEPEDKGGLDPERFSGEAELAIELFRPLRDDVPLEDYEITVTGSVSEGGVANAVPGLDFSGGTVDVDLSSNLLVLTGQGDLGPAPVQFTWRDELDDDGAPANLSASSFISPDFLNRFGIVGRAYVSGDIPVEVQSRVATKGMQDLDVSFDLQEARIDISELGWIKPSGEPARATLSYGSDESMSNSTFVFRSEDARFDGDISLSGNGRLEDLNVREIYIEDLIEAGGEIQRQEDDTFTSEMNGAFLNTSAFFGDFGGVDSDVASFSVPIELDASIDTLRLREGLDLNQATLRFESARAGVREVAARGIIDGGGNLVAVYKGPTAQRAARVSLESDDAGFFMRGLLGQDFLSGGTMALNGTLARGDTPAQLNLTLEQVRMRDAPLLTQILSLASLRGLSDTLSGEGVLFTSVGVPITIAGDRFIIDGARANGPALGLTLNGWIGQSSDDLSLSGVLVPSFGTNSMLGGVPIIGDLFVGRDGEGIFSLTYSVEGTLNRAQVAINPLSAVTPGILRRIFENPADTSIPEGLPVDPDRTPPAPPMPDSEFIESAPGVEN